MRVKRVCRFCMLCLPRGWPKQILSVTNFVPCRSREHPLHAKTSQHLAKADRIAGPLAIVSIRVQSRRWLISECNGRIEKIKLFRLSYWNYSLGLKPLCENLLQNSPMCWGKRDVDLDAGSEGFSFRGRAPSIGSYVESVKPKKKKKARSIKFDFYTFQYNFLLILHFGAFFRSGFWNISLKLLRIVI